MPARPYVVALTGGIGSGKSTIAEKFARLGIQVVDADAISHHLTAPHGAAIGAIQAAFGTDVLRADGGLDRAKMRQRVFEDDAQRVVLESILHPMIAKETTHAIDAASSAYVVWMVPLLAESQRKGPSRADRVLVVDCPESLQIERVMARSQLSRSEVIAIMQRQSPRAERLAIADDVIENAAGLDETEAKVQVLHAQYLRLAQAQNEQRL